MIFDEKKQGAAHARSKLCLALARPACTADILFVFRERSIQRVHHRLDQGDPGGGWVRLPADAAGGQHVHSRG